MLTQPLQDFKKEIASCVVPSGKVEWRVVLHKSVVGIFMILVDVAPMLFPSPPNWRSECKLYHHIYNSLMQCMKHLASFDHLNVRAQERYVENGLEKCNKK